MNENRCNFASGFVDFIIHLKKGLITMLRTTLAVCGLCAVLFLGSCSRKTAEGYYQEGATAELKHDYTTAAAMYESVVNEFPSTVFAESSLVRLGMLYSTEAKDPRKAITVYRRFCELFPDNKQTPTMYFLIGYVYNNDLHLYDSARATYQIFLSRYPKHPLAQSAEFEIQNMGKDPGATLDARVAERKPESTSSPRKTAR